MSLIALTCVLFVFGLLLCVLLLVYWFIFRGLPVLLLIGSCLIWLLLLLVVVGCLLLDLYFVVVVVYLFYLFRFNGVAVSCVYVIIFGVRCEFILVLFGYLMFVCFVLIEFCFCCLVDFFGFRLFGLVDAALLVFGFRYLLVLNLFCIA